MITVIIKYKGIGDTSRRFIDEMISSGIVDSIRKEEGNIRYEYAFPLDDSNSVILIDSWINQEALDKHHQLPSMKMISELREKYDLHMEVEKYQSIDDKNDEKYIRR